MKDPVYITNCITSLLFAGMRAAGIGMGCTDLDKSFMAFAHLYVGGLFTAWYLTRKPIYIILAVTLTVIETACFFYFKLRHT